MTKNNFDHWDSRLTTDTSEMTKNYRDWLDGIINLFVPNSVKPVELILYVQNI